MVRQAGDLLGAPYGQIRAITILPPTPLTRVVAPTPFGREWTPSSFMNFTGSFGLLVDPVLYDLALVDVDGLFGNISC
jgi:hypothetical protein